ncbi:hypothetical protein HB364_13685 [Pseudoflavitalea sp. X16]|uniref:hypothetical protein n=1 Tax=Paraflavitalea devenefica TaxID=2716334 RepID=UPI00142117F0|nr:hypothetical protein [Paraflavitalea devenefica]NII26139.1 hypothetical protein [Paraflavitalea devenefica]
MKQLIVILWLVPAVLPFLPACQPKPVKPPALNMDFFRRLDSLARKEMPRFDLRFACRLMDSASTNLSLDVELRMAKMEYTQQFDTAKINLAKRIKNAMGKEAGMFENLIYLVKDKLADGNELFAIEIFSFVQIDTL